MRRFKKRLQSTAVAGSLLALAAPSLATTNPPRSLHLDGYKTKDAVSFFRLAAETNYFDFQASSEIPRQDASRGDDLSRKQVNSAVARIGPKYEQFNGRLLLGVEGEDRLLGLALSGTSPQDPTNLVPEYSREHLTAEGFIRLRERGDIRKTGQLSYFDAFWNTGWAVTHDSGNLDIASGVMISDAFDKKGFVGGYFGASTDNIGWAASFERDEKDLFYNLAVGRTLQRRDSTDESFNPSATRPYSVLGDLLQGRIKWEEGIQEFTFKYTLAQNPEIPATGIRPNYDGLTSPAGPRILARNEVISRQLRKQQDFGYLENRVSNASGVAASLEVSRERNHHARITPSVGFATYGWGISTGLSVPVSNEDNFEHVVSASLNNRNWPVGFGAKVNYDPETEDFKGELYGRFDNIFRN